MNTIDTFYSRLAFWAPKIVIVTLFMILLTACAPVKNNVMPSPNDKTGSELEVTITEATLNEGENLELEQNIEIVDGNTAIVTTGGSGSCPPLVETVTVEGDIVNFNIKTYGDQMCTMDYRLFPQKIVTEKKDNVFLNKMFQVCSGIGNECFPLIIKNGNQVVGLV